MAPVKQDSPQFRLLPGIDGIPFRLPSGMDIPMLRETDSPMRQPKIVHDAHARVFDMSKPDDAAEYAKVWDMIVKGKAMLGKESINWDETKRCHVVLMRWMNLYLEMPEKGLTHEEIVDGNRGTPVR